MWQSLLNQHGNVDELMDGCAECIVRQHGGGGGGCLLGRQQIHHDLERHGIGQFPEGPTDGSLQCVGFVVVVVVVVWIIVIVVVCGNLRQGLVQNVGTGG